MGVGGASLRIAADGSIIDQSTGLMDWSMDPGVSLLPVGYQFFEFLLIHAVEVLQRKSPMSYLHTTVEK